MAASKGSSDKAVLTREQRQRYAAVFVELDTNGDGWMSRSECRNWIREAGFALQDRQLEAIFRLFDVNVDGKITLDEFFKVMELLHQPPTKNSEAEEQFKQMDTNGDGYLSAEELEVGLKGCGYNVTASQVKKFASNLDKNGDGKISFQEFLKAFE